jgi:uncharacterized protein
MTTFRLAARTAAITVALMISAMPVGAQQPSAGAIAIARELILLKGAAPLYHAVFVGVIEQAKNVFMQQNPMLQKDLNETAAALRVELEPRSAELLTEIARLYAARFTEQELKDVLAFYKTPAGKKMLDEEPKIIDESMSYAQSWGDKLSAEVMEKFRDEMKKRGHDM